MLPAPETGKRKASPSAATRKVMAVITVPKGFSCLGEFDTSEERVTATDEWSWMLLGVKRAFPGGQLVVALVILLRGCHNSLEMQLNKTLYSFSH